MSGGIPTCTQLTADNCRYDGVIESEIIDDPDRYAVYVICTRVMMRGFGALVLTHVLFEHLSIPVFLRVKDCMGAVCAHSQT